MFCLIAEALKLNSETILNLGFHFLSILTCSWASEATKYIVMTEKVTLDFLNDLEEDLYRSQYISLIGFVGSLLIPVTYKMNYDNAIIHSKTLFSIGIFCVKCVCSLPFYMTWRHLLLITEEQHTWILDVINLTYVPTLLVSLAFMSVTVALFGIVLTELYNMSVGNKCFQR